MKTLIQFKTLGLLGVACLLQLSALAQVKQTRQMGAFGAVSASGAVNLVLRQGNPRSVVVEASEEVQKYLITEVQNGALRIYRDKDFNWRDLMGSGKEDKVTVYITCPQLEGITLSGASDVKGEGAFVIDKLDIQTSGASDLTLAIKVKSLEVSCSGASEVKLSGQADRQQVSVSGGSEYQAYALRSKNAEIGASGASEAYIFVDVELESSASGASDIRYRGNARVVSNNASGASSVRQAK